MDEVWVLTHESCIDGSTSFNVFVYKDKKTALNAMKRKKKDIWDNHYKFKNYKKNDDDIFVEETEDSFFVQTCNDDYFEDIWIFKSKVF